MSVSSKFDLFSLDNRSNSFRENMENPILSSLPSMSRSTLAVTHEDLVKFFQCYRFDPKLMLADYKNRQSDFKRLASVALGIPPDGSPSSSSKGKLPSSSPEELKRLKAGLRECTIRARERVKIFSEGLSVFNKCFPSIPSRKRSRPEGDRSNALYSSDRSVLGAGLSKMGAHSLAIPNCFELDQQKSEERAKTSIPNKRTRTSMVDSRTDVWANKPTRPSGSVEREKEMLKLHNKSEVRGEDRTLPAGVDGWEKSKMKKKRSVIKADIPPSIVVPKSNDGYREAKQVMQPRLLSDVRSRLNDSHGLRPGAANGVAGVGKADPTSQQTNLGMRASTLRADLDNGSTNQDRKDRIAGSEKERVHLRTVDKPIVREEFSLESPTSSTKTTSARAPRSASGVVPKMPPVIQRATAANDWELPHLTTKSAASIGPNNRKNLPSTRSSSPPVTQWAGHRQRPQKMSRSARRTSFVPIVSSNNEAPASDNENGSGFARHLAVNSPQQVKLKSSPFSPANISESEESGAVEIKSRYKGKKSDEVDDKGGLNVQKGSTPVLPLRKNKVVSSEIGDGIRRRGRTGRGFASTRSLVPVRVEKRGTAKQLRSGRLGFDKNESKPGRPPTRKLADRKAYTRQKHSTINATADFLVDSDDGHEELLAAANAVINTAHTFSSPFWEKMEPLFDVISDAQIAYLRRQANIGSTTATPNTGNIDVENCNNVPNGFGLTQTGGVLTKAKKTPCEIPLCQRLLAALITEEGNEEEPCCSGSEHFNFEVYGSELDTDLEASVYNHQSSGSFEIDGRDSFKGCRINSTRGSCNSINGGIITSSFDHSQYGIAYSEFQYGSMSIDERLLLEIRSLGLYPEAVPDLAQTRDEEISGDISRLEAKYHEQVSKKQSLLHTLLKSTTERREFQEMEFEQRALDKLVEMAYQKYMSCRGPNGPGGKSGNSEIAKQAALAFAKHTLERCHEFEETGKSCFSEPLFREMFRSRVSQLNDPQLDASTDGESAKYYLNTSNCSLEVRVSGTQQSPSLNNHDIYSSEQTIRKEEWSNSGKKRELLLDEVFGGTLGTTLSSSAKGKRSERDREGKGNNRDVLSKNRPNKMGRPASSNVKGERKNKPMPKQKTTQLSNQPKSTFSSIPKSSEKERADECSFDAANNPEAIDFNILHEVLGNDLDDQGQDLGSWLNIDDDDVLQDLDFMGLEIPMDDLSDLNMMV